MKIKKLLFLILIFSINISHSRDLNFYLDNKYISYKDTFVNELAIKYNYKFNNNFGMTTIGRFFDKKGNCLNLLFYYNNDFHKFEIGNYEDISSTLQTGITNITSNAFNNDYIFYHENTFKIISRPTLLSNQNLGHINNIEYFNKSKHNINFNYLLTFNNLNFGITFTNKYNYYTTNKKNIYNIYKYGLNYNNKIGEIDFDFSFIGENGLKNEFNSYDIGLNFNYYGISFGGNYGFGKDLDKKYFDYISYGIGYEIGPLNFAIWHFKGDFDFNNSTNFDISYNINKNINIYSEFSIFEIDNKKENLFNIGILIKN